MIDLTGDWLFHGHPWYAPHEGKISISLAQDGTRLTGELVQLISPGTGEPPPDVDATRADVDGEIIRDPEGTRHLVLLKRINRQGRFRAVFAGVFDEAAQSISGTFTNNGPGGGTFVMRRA